MINSRKIRTIRFFIILALLILVFDYSYVIARGGRGGGRSFSSSGAARSGSMHSNRSYQASRRSNRGVNQQRTSTGRYDSQADRQQDRRDTQSDRRDYRDDARGDRQDYYDDVRSERREYAERYHDEWHGHHHYEHWESGRAFAAGLVVGTTLSLAAFNSAYPSGCVTTYVGNTAYYQCGTTWYQRAYRHGSVTYIVVNPPG